MPTVKTVDQIKKALLQPALTTHYDVLITIPSEKGDVSKFTSYLAANGIIWTTNQEDIQMACCEAILPGSNLATSEINGDFVGVTERHVHRRIYDDRIDLSFYVQATTGSNAYAVIKFFESWMKYTTNESVSGNNSIEKGSFYYQIKYPEEYYGGLQITKFERDSKVGNLTYKFVNIFPISMSSMPISYESASLLKVTVSFSYIRYYIAESGGDPVGDATATSPTPQSDPFTQAQFNASNLTLPALSGAGALKPNPAAIPQNVQNASGHTVTTNVIGATPGFDANVG